jgi:hypothetical protein
MAGTAYMKLGKSRDGASQPVPHATAIGGVYVGIQRASCRAVDDLALRALARRGAGRPVIWADDLDETSVEWADED